MNLEELTKQKQLYESTKEILEKVINSFSSINFNDDMLSIKKALTSYFCINDEDLYTSKVSNASETINVNVDKLKELLVTVDTELEIIKKKILDAELANSL